MRTIITVEGIKCYAYHGCVDQEGLIGSDYVVDVHISMDLSKSMESDELIHTADYVMVTEVVRSQMAIRSKLIEHVGGRILKVLAKKISGKKSIELKIKKINPPVNSQLSAAVFTVSEDFIS